MSVSDSQYFRKKVTFLNVFLTLLIVLLHAKSPERWGLPINMDHPLICVVSQFANIGVPFFFFISGVLFYRDVTYQNIGRKLKSRFHSLLVPYLIWNTVFVAIFYVLLHIPQTAGRMQSECSLNTLSEVVNGILNARFTVLWFVKVLIVYTVFSPILLFCIKKLSWAIVFFVGTVILARFADYGYESVIGWLPIYITGAIMGRFGLGRLEKYDYSFSNVINSRVAQRCTTVVLIIAFWGLFLLSFRNRLYLDVFRFSSPVIVWVLVDFMLYDYLMNIFEVKTWMTYMFFIYCTHHFVLNVLQKIVVLNFPPTSVVLNVTFLGSFVITICLLVFTAKWLSRFKFYKYLSGGR